MIKVYCDICCRQLKDDYSNVININFNCYGVAKFAEPKTYNLCKRCAIEVREYLDGQTGRVPESEGKNEDT